MPVQLAALAAWAANFSTVLTAAPADYDLVAGDAVIVAAAVDPFTAAYAISSTPATRTSVTIAATDAARAAMEAVVRPYAVAISANSAVSAGDKTTIGVTNRILTKTRNSVVAAEITVEVNYSDIGLPIIRSQDPSTPLSKKRPLGATQWQVEFRGKDSGDPAWTKVQLLNVSRPQITVDQNDFDTLFEQYEMRQRWCGPLLPGGAPNCGPWSAWAPIVF
jgi:hypothetical protein